MTFIRIGFTASMLFCALLAAAAVAQEQDQKQSPDMQALAAYVKFLSSGVVQGEQVPGELAFGSIVLIPLLFSRTRFFADNLANDLRSRAGAWLS